MEKLVFALLVVAMIGMISFMFTKVIPKLGDDIEKPVKVRKVKKSLKEYDQKLKKHKIAVHCLCLAAVFVSLVIEGGSVADWSFVALAVACELA